MWLPHALVGLCNGESWQARAWGRSENGGHGQCDGVLVSGVVSVVVLLLGQSTQCGARLLSVSVVSVVPRGLARWIDCRRISPPGWLGTLTARRAHWTESR